MIGAQPKTCRSKLLATLYESVNKVVHQVTESINKISIFKLNVSRKNKTKILQAAKIKKGKYVPVLCLIEMPKNKKTTSCSVLTSPNKDETGLSALAC